jgi:hypothetical protein
MRCHLGSTQIRHAYANSINSRVVRNNSALCAGFVDLSENNRMTASACKHKMNTVCFNYINEQIK